MPWIECPECGGDKTIEVEDYKPQSPSRDIGEIYTRDVTCPECGGNGEIETEEEE